MTVFKNSGVSHCHESSDRIFRIFPSGVSSHAGGWSPWRPKAVKSILKETV